MRLPRLASELEKVPVRSELHVDFQHLDYIDHACLDLLMTWAKQHEATGGKLVIDWESLHGRFNRERHASQLRDGGRFQRWQEHHRPADGSSTRSITRV